MRKFSIARAALLSALAVLATLAAIAGDARAAEEWGIDNEQAVRFEAKVVDILCELSGDCPAKCGAGKRQLGLLKDDGTLVVAVKNFELFAGAANDLIPFCGERVVADGLLINDPRMPIFALQFKRRARGGKWRRANWFIRDWAKTQGVARDSATAKQWYNNDPTVKAVIARDGVFGIPGLKPEE
jgi:hypothetical protein